MPKATHHVFPDAPSISVQGMYLGERLATRQNLGREVLSRAPLTIRLEGGGCAVLFRYGVVVTFNVEEDQRRLLQEDLARLVSNPFKNPETEPLTVRFSAEEPDHLDKDGVLRLKSSNLVGLQVVAEVLAKSIVLAHYEAEMARAFERLEPVAARLAAGSRPPAGQRALLTELGEAILAQTRIIGRVETGDKPEIVWDDPHMDRLYVRLAREYELAEREGILRRKTALVSDTTGVFIDLLAHRQTLRVEWYIVILIVIEIVLILVELFFLK
jgi:uncharacterized Rmd1/YagE family protein